jgi:hypothetical protein
MYATFNATGNWTAPAGTNLAFVSIHSATAGGATFTDRYNGNVGGRYFPQTGGTGSVSGAYVQVTPGSSHAVTIGAGGAGATSSGVGNNRTGVVAAQGGSTIFDSAFTATGSTGAGNAGRYFNGSAAAAASAATGTTTLTTVNPGSATLTRVGTISSQNTGGRAGGAAGNHSGDTRYGTVNAGGAGLTGLVHIYI